MLEPGRRGDVGVRRVLQPLARRRDDEWERAVAGQPLRVVVALDVEELVRDLVAREEVAEAVAVGAPAVGDEAEAAVAGPPPRPPVVEEVVEDGVELLLGRVPRLEEVVVDAAVVDGADRGVGVGVGREERALGPRRDLGDGLQDRDAVEPGHPLVGEHEGDGLAALRQLADGVDGLGAGPRPDDAVGVAVAAAEVAGDGAEHLGVVVDDDEGGVGGRRPCGGSP